MKEHKRRELLQNTFRLADGEFYQHQQEFIVNQMTKLYSMFTTPYIIVPESEDGYLIDQIFVDTELIERGVRWRSEKAKALYDKYGEMLRTERNYETTGFR